MSGAGWGENEESLFQGCGIFLGGDERVLELDSGDGCTTLQCT